MNNHNLNEINSLYIPAINMADRYLRGQRKKYEFIEVLVTAKMILEFIKGEMKNSSEERIDIDYIFGTKDKYHDRKVEEGREG